MTDLNSREDGNPTNNKEEAEKKSHITWSMENRMMEQKKLWQLPTQGHQNEFSVISKRILTRKTPQMKPDQIKWRKNNIRL